MTATVTSSVISGVFPDKTTAESAILDLRTLGLTDEDIGVAVPQPGIYVIQQHAEEDTVKGLAEGVAVGAPIGALAGIALMAVAVPAAAPVAVGMGGLLLGAAGGAGWGSLLGGATGFGVRVRVDDLEDRYCDIPLGGEDVLVVARAGKHRTQVRHVMRVHGARCFMDEATPATQGAL